MCKNQVLSKMGIAASRVTKPSRDFRIDCMAKRIE